MNSNVVLSICIPTFNRRDAIYECVTKILDNYHYDDIEVIVSDNCSVDGTREKLSTIDDKRFRYYRNDVNTKYINLLIALSHAEGQFSMLLSDEDEVDTKLLREILRYLGGKTKPAIIKSDVYNGIYGFKWSFISDVSSYYNKIMAIFKWGYLSGIIYNNRYIQPILKKMDFNDSERYRKIIGEYPHIWLALMICHRGGLVFYQKALVRMSKECKSDNVLDKKKTNEFTWTIDRRFAQEIAISKSFKHLQLSQLDSSEKIALYCSRVLQLMAATGSIYYETLYGKSHEFLISNYHPEDMPALNYWRKQPHHILKNIIISYKICNRFTVSSLWENKMDFIKDCMKNFTLIGRLYYDTLKEYQKSVKYLRKIHSDSYGLEK